MRQSLGLRVLAAICFGFLCLNLLLRSDSSNGGDDDDVNPPPLQRPVVPALIRSPVPSPTVPPIAAAAPEHPECDKSLKLIHLPLSVTSRNLRERVTNFEALPLFKFALSSFLVSVEPDLFRYSIAIAADSGDLWYDNAIHIAHMLAWWRTRWTAHWPDACLAPLTFTAFANTRSRNTWAINYVAEQAYHTGADYFFRINDDTVLKTRNWSSAYAAELEAMRPIPGLGVTGPSDTNNRTLLTHCFVGRLHFVAFGTFFSYELGNWWTDDLIQFVYAPPYNASVFGEDAHMMSILAHVVVEHKALTSRYEIKSTMARYWRLAHLVREEFEDFVIGYLRAQNASSIKES